MKKIPPDNTGKKYLVKRSAKQDKFIDIYVSGYGELTATECAIRAGYEKSSAHTRAHELLDWRQNPEVVKQIANVKKGFHCLLLDICTESAGAQSPSSSLFVRIPGSCISKAAEHFRK